MFTNIEVYKVTMELFYTTKYIFDESLIQLTNICKKYDLYKNNF